MLAEAGITLQQLTATLTLLSNMEGISWDQEGASRWCSCTGAGRAIVFLHTSMLEGITVPSSTFCGNSVSFVMVNMPKCSELVVWSRFLSFSCIFSLGLYQLAMPQQMCLTMVVREWKFGRKGQLRLGQIRNAYSAKPRAHLLQRLPIYESVRWKADSALLRTYDSVNRLASLHSIWRQNVG